MGLAKYLRQAWKKPDSATLRGRMAVWRAGERIVKISGPTRLDRAHALGYRAKKGFVIARVIIGRGGHKREKPVRGRKSSKQSSKKVLKMSYQWIAEQRCQRKFTNLEVLNSYMLGKDGKYYFFEVIMVDPNRPEIKSDKRINWICGPENRNRALRGLTSAAKKSRGLRKKSRNLKVRPSQRAWQRKGK